MQLADDKMMTACGIFHANFRHFVLSELGHNFMAFYRSMTKNLHVSGEDYYRMCI